MKIIILTSAFLISTLSMSYAENDIYCKNCQKGPTVIDMTGTQQKSKAQQIAGFLQAISGFHKRQEVEQQQQKLKQDMNRQIAAGQLEPSYTVDPTTGRVTATYKPKQK